MHIASVVTVITACFDLRKGATAAPETSSCMFLLTCLVEVVLSIFEGQEFRGLTLRDKVLIRRRAKEEEGRPDLHFQHEERTEQLHTAARA